MRGGCEDGAGSSSFARSIGRNAASSNCGVVSVNAAPSGLTQQPTSTLERGSMARNQMLTKTTLVNTMAGWII